MRFGMIQQEQELEGLSYEQAAEELAALVSRLEEGRSSLQELEDLHSRGNMLIAHCKKLLESAQAKYKKLSKSKGKDA